MFLLTVIFTFIMYTICKYVSLFVLSYPERGSIESINLILSYLILSYLIYGRFRTCYGNTRELKELKEQWKRMKMAAKSEFSEWVTSKGQTGGGSPPSSPSQIAKIVKGLIPLEFVQIRNPYDCDDIITADNDEAVSVLHFMSGQANVETPSQYVSKLSTLDGRRGSI